MEYTENEGKIQIKATSKQLSLKESTKEAPKQFILENETKITSAQIGWVEISVQDSGSGLSTEEIQAFWNATQFNLNDLHSGQASGLGLCISRRIAEQHDGKIEVTSAGPGCGTRFSLILPLREVPEEARPKLPVKTITSEEEETVITSDADKPKKFKILLVDDAKVCRKLLMRLLTAKGHDCDEAENGLKAVEMVQKAINEGTQYDTILCDYEMPGKHFEGYVYIACRVCLSCTLLTAFCDNHNDSHERPRSSIQDACHGIHQVYCWLDRKCTP
jgi:hypothetical protein